MSPLATALRALGRGARRACAAWQAFWRGGREPRLRVKLVAERPRRPKRDRLYVTQQSGGAPAFGVLACPCGCGEVLNLRFFGARRPRWSVTWDEARRPTVEPSIWRQAGCRSHFHLVAGRIHWC